MALYRSKAMKLPKPLKCSEVSNSKLLLSLLRRELDEEYEDRLLAHLRSCPRCLSRLAILISENNYAELNAPR